MMTIEDRLIEASADARDQVRQIDSRPASTVGRRVQGRRALLGTAAVAVVFGAFGATALVTGSGTSYDAANSSVGAATESVVPSTTPVAVGSTSEAGPRLAVTLDGWEITVATDEESGSLLMYRSSVDDSDLPRIAIETRSDNPTDSPGERYQEALVSASATGESLGSVDLYDGSSAEAYTYTDTNSGNRVSCSCGSPQISPP